MEDLPMIEGDKYYYFYEDGEIFLGEPLLKGKVSDFFQFLHRQVGGDCYIAAEELAMFCRDLLPMVRESFDVIPEGFDEALYVPPKPEFELYLDRQAMDVVGAKLVAVYGDNKYNVLAKVEPGEVRDLSEELRIKSLWSRISMSMTIRRHFLSLQKTKICSISSCGWIAAFKPFYGNLHVGQVPEYESGQCAERIRGCLLKE